MMPTFPIPRPPISGGFSQSGPARATVRTQMEVGPPKVRRRSSMGLRTISAVYVVTTAETVAFEAWYRADIAMGALSFDWTEPRTGETRSAKFAEESGGYGLTEMTHGRWQLSVTLEVWA